MKRLVVCAAAAALLACVGPEEEILERYLLASQRGDSPTVAALSMVAFPEDDVQSWNILEISELPSEPYAIPVLRETVGLVEDERDAQFTVFGEFRRENYESLRRIQARLREEPDYHFSGRLGELQDEWDAFRLERRQVVAKPHEAEIAFEREIRRVNKSLQRESSPEYLTGEMLLKNARVRVTTELGDGHFDFTLTRYALKNQFDALVPARWIITAIDKTS
jgi:hypothetical protein